MSRKYKKPLLYDNYFKLPEKPTVFFDVDSTLVFAATDLPQDYTGQFHWIVFINEQDFYVHHIHVNKIKEFKARGHNVVVWSAGGSDWAEQVVIALELSAHVDLIIEKPRWYFDDKPVNEWIGSLCYVDIFKK